MVETPKVDAALADLFKVAEKMKEAKRDASNYEKYELILKMARTRIQENWGRSITQGRGDQPLVKFFYQEGLPVERSHWDVPLIHFCDGEFNADLWAHKPESLPGETREDTGERLLQEGKKYFAWNDCILYFTNQIDLSRTWYLTTRQESARVFQAYTLFQDGKWVVCQLTFDENGSEVKTRNLKDCDDMHMDFLAHSAGVLMSYLVQTAEHTVEVRPANPKVAKGSKTAKKKPWLRDDAPHIILLDPSKARVSHGLQAGNSTAERLPPRAHARRGHRRTYKATDKRDEFSIYIKPTWIGPEEWAHKNIIYKIVGNKLKEDT